MTSLAEQRPQEIEIASSDAPRNSLLEEGNFKRLMNIQGWWVDTARFDNDPLYASELVRFATASQSFALRESATLLQAQMGDPLTETASLYACTRPYMEQRDQFNSPMPCRPLS